MKALNALLTVVTMAMLGGCGGGGGSDVGTTGNAPQPTPPVVAPTTVTNPLTGTAAPGSPTETLAGFAYVGASVTAYSVLADGTSGPAIAGPVVATINGFTLNFNDAPTSWVRLVATGGTKTRAADNTVQPGGTMQLVTPFVTTSQNNLKITPLTDIAAAVMATQVKNGATLADAFTTGMRSMLSLDVANVFMSTDSTVHLNVLQGDINSDTMHYSAASLGSAELLDGLDYLGVMLDMPTKDVVRVVSASAQGNYAQSGVDGAGAVINAGAWTGNTFDASASQSLKALLDVKLPVDQKVTDATGGKVAPRINDYVSKYMVMDFTLDAACRSGASAFLLSRYPFYALDSQNRIQAVDCNAAAQRIADLKVRIATNKSSSMK
jgi:hypothetical protein